MSEDAQQHHRSLQDMLVYVKLFHMFINWIQVKIIVIVY